MTGFSSLSEQVDVPGIGPTTIVIELKTLNSRFFEVVAKLPSCLSSLEVPFTNVLQEKLIRGRIYINVRFDEKQGGLELIVPSFKTIDQYVSAVKVIQEKYKFSGTLTIQDVIRLPNALVAQQGELDQKLAEILQGLVAKSAEAVMRIRTQEGNRLEKDFEKIFKLCGDKIKDIEKIFNQVIEQHKETLRQALAANPHPEQPNQHIEELQATLKKIDIHEEIIRFKSHLESIPVVLKASGIEKGKRLDFILQELLRESNTMMAKCPAYQISAICIDIKVELEKAREQIQNIV